MDTFLINQLQALSRQYELDLPDNFYDLTSEFARILFEWNKTHSLTTYKNSTDLANNIFNSVYPIKFLPNFQTCLDVGSGAGFPGILLAIALPQVEFVLTEPKGKKYAFLEFIKIALELKNTTIVKERVENITQKFELITSRAVASQELLSKICANVMNEQCKMLLYKGEKEIAKVENSDNDAQVFQMPFGNYILM